MVTCLISLGSNLGSRSEQLHHAIERLQQTPGVEVQAVSRWHETVPVGGPPGQATFLNGAARLQTTLSAQELMTTLLKIEAEVGRTRRIHWEARLLDLDLLLYADEVIQTENVTVPHPRMSFRRFVLEPAAEVGGEMVHPQIGWTIQQLLDHLNLPSTWLAIAAPPGINRTRFAQQVALQQGGKVLSLDWPVMPRSETSLDWYHALLATATEQHQEIVKADQDQVLLTDYWLPQLLLEAQLCLSDDTANKFTAVWQFAAESLPIPKLIVSLQASDHWLENQFREQYPDLLHEVSTEHLQEYACRLTQILGQSGIGPVLPLSVEDSLQQAFHHTQAAIQAME